MTGILGVDLLGSFLLGVAPTAPATTIAALAALADEDDGGLE